jgi:hypothetical protein
MSVDKLFVDSPGLNKYFFEGSSISRDDWQYDKAASVANYFLDFIDGYFSSSLHLSQESSDPAKWNAFFKSVFRNSQIMCSVLRENTDVYNDDLAELARKPCCWFAGDLDDAP